MYFRFLNGSADPWSKDSEEKGLRVSSLRLSTESFGLYFEPYPFGGLW
jgi:hypothetical protein